LLVGGTKAQAAVMIKAKRNRARTMVTV